jgi:hypothetical protein
MTDHDEDICSASDEVDMVAELTEEITRRLEAGEPLNGDDLGDNPACAGPVRQLLPTLRTMLSLGEQVAREEGSRARSKMKKKRPSSSFPDHSLEFEEVGP